MVAKFLAGLCDRIRAGLSAIARSSFDPPEPLAPPGPVPHIDPTDKLGNGRRAQALLADTFLAGVFEEVANKYRASWENASRGDFEAQRIAHLSLAALKDVQGALRAHIGNAKLTEAELARQKKIAASRY